MTAFYALRSLLFYAGYAPVVAIFATLGFTVGLLMPSRPRQAMVTFGNALIIRWLRLTCGVKVKLIGADNIPDRPFVALSKHQSNWETYFLQRLFRPVSTILKRELLKIPFFGWGLKTTDPIAIDRGNPRQALREIIRQGQERLKAGNNVIIYPEGTRLNPGQSGTYGRSGTALAIAAKAPILPVALNAGHCWPARRFIKYPGTVTVVIGKAIDPGDETDSKRLMQEVRDWIESTQGRIDRLH